MKYFVNYSGTKETFKDLEEQYYKYIVFIKGSDLIYTHGHYYGDLKDAFEALKVEISDSINMLKEQVDTTDSDLYNSIESLGNDLANNIDELTKLINFNKDSIQEQIDTLVNADASTAINTFNEIVAFLEGIENSEDLAGILVKLKQEIKDFQITEDITVVGGPLASLLNQSGITKINSGTSLQSLLTMLLCKELYPYNSINDSWYLGDSGQKKIAYQTPSLSNSISAPSISGFTTGSVEVGTEFTFTVSCSASYTSATSAQVSNLTWGYYLDDKSTNTSITESWDIDIDVDSYTLKTTVNNGFGGISIENKTGTHNYKPSYSQKVTVHEGYNKITWNVTGASYKGEIEEIPSVLIVSNLGNTNSDIKTNKIEAKSVTCSQPTNSTYKEVTGVRYSFAGTRDSMELNSTNIRKLNSKGTSTQFDITIPENTSHVYVAVPSGKTLTNVLDSNAFGTDIVGSFVANEDIPVEGANGYTATNYTVYVYTPDTLLSANNYTIKLG